MHHPWSCLLAPLLIILLLIPAALRATDHLTPVGWVPDDAEASRVQAIIDAEFDQAGNSHFILFSDPNGQLTPMDREFRLDVERAVRPFRADPAIAAVYTWGTTSNETLNEILISEDGTRSIAVIVLTDDDVAAMDAMDHLNGTLVETSLDAQIGGWPATTSAILDVAENDLLRAEMLSLPVTLVLLLVIFGGVIAAGLPIALAVLTMISTFAFMFFLSTATLVSTFAINAVTMLGLAVSIDYALIMLSRFREEQAHHPINVAVTRTMTTAGRAVIVAGSTVAIGLTGLMLFRVPAAITTGIIGAFVILTAVLLALTALPAVFVLFGHRIGPRRATRASAPNWARRIWVQVGNGRRRFPLATVLLCSGILIALALPVRHMEVSSPTISSLPPGTEARVVAETISESFPHASISPIAIVVQPTSGTMYDAANLERLQRLVTELEAHPGIDRAESIWSLLPAAMTPNAYSTSLLLEPELARVSTPYITSNASLINLVVESDLSMDEQRDLVRELREGMTALTGGELSFLVGGELGMDVDVISFATDQTPAVAIYILVLTWLALFIQLRSWFLPFKAIALNLLSIGASFGALVWIFQDGHLENILRFEPTGTTIVLVPVLMFCFLFGLSMDFEVIILSRIRESWLDTGDNDVAVEHGLRRTSGIIISSAIVMLAVFAAFSTSDLQVIKTLGVGLSIAIVLDATVIRMLLLPATMQLMGQWNWVGPSRKRATDATLAPERSIR